MEDEHPWAVKNPVTGESIDDLVARMDTHQKEDFARRALQVLERRLAVERTRRTMPFYVGTGV